MSCAESAAAAGCLCVPLEYAPAPDSCSELFLFDWFANLEQSVLVVWKANLVRAFPHGYLKP